MYRDFFDLLAPRLESARKCERELNQCHAHRFNALDYLRTDELGLSRIIADLLKAGADAAHGQGSLFLRTFLTKLDIDLAISDSDLGKSKVSLEHQIKNGRRIDIYVEIPKGDGLFRLAVENKPYTKDSENQVKDYLEYLQSKGQPSDFLLIYLSPAGEGPSKRSLPKEELKLWAEQFIIMPYHEQYAGGNVEDVDQETIVFKKYRAPCSLTDWLAACRKKCQRVKRLEWFLGETQSFCQRKFGDQAMADSSEKKALEEYLHQNLEHLQIAQSVYDSWAEIKKNICKRFLENLCEQIRDKLQSDAEDICFDCEYTNNRAYKCNLWFYRSSWKAYKGCEKIQNSQPKTTTIWLQNESSGPQAWIYGVSSPLKKGAMNEKSDIVRFDELCRELWQDKKLKQMLNGREKKNEWWPIYTQVDQSMQDWTKLLRYLYQESEGEGSKITKYYVDSLVKFADAAIPIIDKVEKTLRDHGHSTPV